jgi:hypothetical protein
MILWKVEPRYPKPFSPVHKALKLATVLGTTSERSATSIVPKEDDLVDTDSEQYTVPEE